MCLENGHGDSGKVLSTSHTGMLFSSVSNYMWMAHSSGLTLKRSICAVDLIAVEAEYIRPHPESVL